MKAIIVRNIEVEIKELSHNERVYREKTIHSPNYAQIKNDKPLEFVYGEEITFLHEKVLSREGILDYYVKPNDKNLFEDLIKVSNYTFEKEIDRRVQVAIEQFTHYHLPEIERQERIHAQAEVASLPFIKKIKLCFGL